jgi:hypothetical protein
MGFAACIGPGIHSCSENKNTIKFPIKRDKKQDDSEHEGFEQFKIKRLINNLN